MNATTPATIIAEVILATDTDARGTLLAQVAAILRDNGQGYTSSLFFKIAEEYGL